LLAAQKILGSAGGAISGAGVMFSFDTRDNVYFPFSGRYYNAAASWFGGAIGSDYDFANYNVDLRQYFSVTPSQILATQLLMNFISGDPPFPALAQLGGKSLMRGYYTGRYRDKQLIVLQAEYRLILSRRFGLAGFAGIGEVAEKLTRFALRDFKASYGAGIRYAVSPKEKINIRLDLGFGQEPFVGPIITIAEAF